MGKMSREKGKRGEREVAELFRSYGYEARRGQQFAGGGDSPDVIHSLPGFHVEVKFVEAFQLYKALEQASEDRPSGKVPVVFHRRKNKNWVVVMDADDFLELFEGEDNEVPEAP
jgi:Holliday junction resolvase